MNRNNRIKLITGLISFLYYTIPIIQDHIYKFPIDRFNDHCIFSLSLTLYQSVRVISSESIFPYLVQLIAALITWLILFGITKYTFRFFIKSQSPTHTIENTINKLN
jgi:hypothetical protein